MPEATMLRPTESSDPNQHSFHASNIPPLSMVEPYHLASTQPSPNPSPHHHQSLPSFSSSFQPHFASPPPHVQHSVPHQYVTLPPDPLPPSQPFNQNIPGQYGFSVLPNLSTTQYHSSSQAQLINLSPTSVPVSTAPLFHNSNQHSSVQPVYVSLPPVTHSASPPVQYINLPPASNDCPPITPSTALSRRQPGDDATACVKKTAKTKKTKKKTSAAKRSRSKKPKPPPLQTSSPQQPPEIAGSPAVSQQQALSAIPSLPKESDPSIRTHAGSPPDTARFECTTTLPSMNLHQSTIPAYSAQPNARSAKKHAPPVATFPSIPTTARPNMIFTAPKPQQERPGLNFADVALEKSSYRADYPYLSTSPWSNALQACETIASINNAVTQQYAPQQLKGSSDLRGDGTDANNAHASQPTVTKDASKMLADGHVTGLKTFSRQKPVPKRRRSSQMSRQKASAKTSKGRRGADPKPVAHPQPSQSIRCPPATSQQGDKDRVERDVQLPGYRDASHSKTNHGEARTTANGWSGCAAMYNCEKPCKVTSSGSIVQASGKPALGGAMAPAQSTAENIQNAAECLMTLAGTGTPPSTDGCDSIGLGTEGQMASGEMIVSHRKSKAGNGKRNASSCKERKTNLTWERGMHLNDGHSRHNGSDMPECGQIPTQKNLGNFLVQAISQRHVMYSNQGQPIDSIPKPYSSSLSETPQAAQCWPTAATAQLQDPALQNAGGTPVNIRDSRDMFTGLPIIPTRQLSGNHSLVPESPQFEQISTTPQQDVHHQPQQSSKAANNVGHPVQVVRPLFQDRNIVPSSPAQSLQTPNLGTNHTDQSQHQKSSAGSSNCEKTHSMNTATNLTTPPHHFQTTAASLTPPSPLRSLQIPCKSPTPQNKPQPKKQAKRNLLPGKADAQSEAKRLGRTSAKTTKPKKPRKRKKPAAASPPIPTSTSADAAVSLFPGNSGQRTSLPPLSVARDKALDVPMLRLRASFSSNQGAELPTANSPMLSTGRVDQRGEKQRLPRDALANSQRCPILPSCAQNLAGPAKIHTMRLSNSDAGHEIPSSSNAVNVAIPGSQNTYSEKNHAISGKTLKLRENEIQRGEQGVSRTEGHASTPLRSHGCAEDKLPPRSQQPTAHHSSCETFPPFAIASARPDNRTSLDQRSGARGGVPTNILHLKNLPTCTTFERPAQARVIPAYPLLVAMQGNHEDHGLSSPRTDCTQQTLPPDSSSLSPSVIETSSENDNIPLAQARKRKGAVSLAASKAQDSQTYRKSIACQEQSSSVPQRRSSTGSRSRKAQTKPDCLSAIVPGTKVSEVKDRSLSSKKRQSSSKTQDANKRRKKSSAMSPGKKVLVDKKAPQTDKNAGHCGEKATPDAVVQCRKSTSTALKSSARKKSSVKARPASKKDRQPVHIRKTSSSITEVKGKEKSKGDSFNPAALTERSTSDVAANLRLSLSLPAKDGQSVPVPRIKASRVSCGSPVTQEKTLDEGGDSSKSLQKKRCQARNVPHKIAGNCNEEETQPEPCFAKELKSLQASGFLTTNERKSSLASSRNLSLDLTTMPGTLCVLCQKHGLLEEMVKHPCFPIKAFDICKSCSHIVSKRVEEHGAKRKSLAAASKASSSQKTTLFVMLIEEMVSSFTPSGSEHRDVQRIYDYVRTRNCTDRLERAQSLSIHLDMLAVLRVTLRKVGFSVRGGKLKWPIAGFKLPTFADTHALISNAIPARIEDLKRGILPGAAAWNETFGDGESISAQRSSCDIYEKIFGLIGLRLNHQRECSAHESSSGPCIVKLDSLSMGVLMYRTSAMLSGTVTQELLASCWTKEEAFRFIDETEIERITQTYDGAPTSCCICGSSQQFREHSCTFRFSNCSECPKSFCSVCLLNVLGASEYLRSFSDGGYCCMLCRFRHNAELFPNGKPNRGEQDRRLRLHNFGTKRKTEKRLRNMPPLLLLSSSARADILLRQGSQETRKLLGIAKFCEAANDNNVRNATGSQSTGDVHDICLQCKLSATSAEQEIDEGEVLVCSHENCINVMHKSCIGPQLQARRRGSRSKWTCPHHQCSRCEQRDDSKLLRCRTCPVTYCKEHMSLPSEVYLYSEKSFACSTCKSFLREPQMASLKPLGSKAERRKNQIVQALVISQRKRSAAIKTLSEHPGCYDAASNALSEFRCELEMK